jgi:transposase
MSCSARQCPHLVDHGGKRLLGHAQRARILLLATDGLANNEIADKVGCNQATAVKWRRRFIERGLDGLPDDPRPGTARTISDDAVTRVHPTPS